MKKKLIEVALPLDAINAASAREKSIRHGHPSTLHLWWARRPLATARAVLFASLVDDPSAHPEEFPTEEAQDKERQRLFCLLEQLVKWENSNNKRVLDAAKAEIMKSTDGNPPPLLDPFAGGGTIPLEAQRLGLEAHAHDLNPVAVMINKAMIEIPPKFAEQPPVNPEAQKNKLTEDDWSGTRGLAEDVRYYGEWMNQKAFEQIGHLYPKVKDAEGQEHTVIAWLWARAVKCPNPACGCEMPLASSFILSKKRNNEMVVEPIAENGKIHYFVRYGKDAIDGTVARSGGRCVFCNTPVGFDYIRGEGKAHRIASQLMAVVAKGDSGRVYISPDEEQISAASIQKPSSYPSGELHGKSRVNVGLYGFNETSDLFTNRQLVALTTFCDLVTEVREQIERDGGSVEYAQAVSVYLALSIDKLTNISSAIVSWMNDRGALRETFARQAIPMVWDYAESNPFSKAGGSWEAVLDKVVNVIRAYPRAAMGGNAVQFDAQLDKEGRNVMVSTDPPYYDNISYADLSDFFYVWLRKNLKDIYPELFKTMLVPKIEELVATPYRFGGQKDQAKKFFEEGMLRAVTQIKIMAREDIPISIYYAFKQRELDKGGDEQQSVSTGWETMLSAILQAGLSITGTWPIKTESSGRVNSQNANVLASSIVLVCRKRPADAPICTRRDFLSALKRELRPAIMNLQQSNIAPVDMAQSAIGPSMAVYSRYAQVLEADGSPMTVRSALKLINQALDDYFHGQGENLDAESRFAVDLYAQCGFNEIAFGEADVLARARNVAMNRLQDMGIVHAAKGKVRLKDRDELPSKLSTGDSTWLWVQTLVRELGGSGIEGCAKRLSEVISSGEGIKHLAYRLYQIADKKGWAQEGTGYNNLVISWPDIMTRREELRNQQVEVMSFDF